MNEAGFKALQGNSGSDVKIKVLEPRALRIFGGFASLNPPYSLGDLSGFLPDVLLGGCMISYFSQNTK